MRVCNDVSACRGYGLNGRPGSTIYGIVDIEFPVCIRRFVIKLEGLNGIAIGRGCGMRIGAIVLCERIPSHLQRVAAG